MSAGVGRTGLKRRLIETAAHGDRGQLHEDEQHAEVRCCHCDDSHFGELYESPPDRFYVRYYCTSTGVQERRSYI